AIRALSGTSIFIQYSTVSGNKSTNTGQYSASGIAVKAGTNAATGASLVIRESTISGNSAAGESGGIYFNGTVNGNGFKILNSTVANNTSSSNGGGIRIRTMDGTLLIQNSTVVNNTASFNGGGIDHFHPSVGFGGAATSIISIESSVFAN